jgi:hypothetical protein
MRLSCFSISRPTKIPFGSTTASSTLPTCAVGENVAARTAWPDQAMLAAFHSARVCGVSSRR